MSRSPHSKHPIAPAPALNVRVYSADNVTQLLEPVNAGLGMAAPGAAGAAGSPALEGEALATARFLSTAAAQLKCLKSRMLTRLHHTGRLDHSAAAAGARWRAALRAPPPDSYLALKPGTAGAGAAAGAARDLERLVVKALLDSRVKLPLLAASLHSMVRGDQGAKWRGAGGMGRQQAPPVRAAPCEAAGGGGGRSERAGRALRLHIRAGGAPSVRGADHATGGVRHAPCAMRTPPPPPCPPGRPAAPDRAGRGALLAPAGAGQAAGEGARQEGEGRLRRAWGAAAHSSTRLRAAGGAGEPRRGACMPAA